MDVIVEVNVGVFVGVRIGVTVGIRAGVGEGTLGVTVGKSRLRPTKVVTEFAGKVYENTPPAADTSVCWARFSVDDVT